MWRLRIESPEGFVNNAKLGISWPTRSKSIDAPGSAIWRLEDGNSFVSLTADGLATPIAAGTAHAVAKVDGVDSNSSSITVDTEAADIHSSS